MTNNPGKQAPLTRHRQEDWDEACEAYLLAHAPGLKDRYAAQQRAFLQIEEDALSRHPDPTPDAIARHKRRRLLSRPGRGRRLNCVAASCLWRLTCPVRSGAAESASFSGISAPETVPTLHP